ncbi:hypothetical protein HBH98_127650 [Parastagonospora nodorum]|nr:hypothetical protein HBI09_079290 [Parastagonospora nodorum]KAH4051657.1 hypothetical protein HBH49_106340 [Parastagonospora nodorum]KAH4344740.1 hypothetical protein HBH98_127650 [Parastagonospora nodorum]KAH4365119.1 hypothetical protein HBH97_173630 [Parastagonospora nodorum]KAH4383681.1 hypothetical protein HBH99_185510 [Parastagonospora nodorum]
MASTLPGGPLQKATNKDFQSLGEELWGWTMCGVCVGQDACSDKACPWSRAKKLRSFWAYYESMTATYVPHFCPAEPVLKSHGDITDLIHCMKLRSNLTRDALSVHHFVDNHEHPDYKPIIADDRAEAINLAASILLLVHCGKLYGRSNIDNDVLRPTLWETLSLDAFIDEAFPMASNIMVEKARDLTSVKIRAKLTARNLSREGGFRFQATTDLRSHLLMDLKNRVVHVFDRTAVLRELLVSSQASPESCILPRKLLIEALATIHKILFPEETELDYLDSLVAKGVFDRDLQRRQWTDRDSDDNSPVTFVYFSNQLNMLYDEIDDPSPRGRLESWFDRKSRAKSANRHMLMATMIGVFIAVTIGLLSLGVATFQAWVAYQQWKHPVQSGDGT